jgi:hypothetical protein
LQWSLLFAGTPDVDGVSTVVDVLLLLWFPVVAYAAVDPSVAAVLSVVDVLESCCFVFLLLLPPILMLTSFLLLVFPTYLASLLLLASMLLQVKSFIFAKPLAFTCTSLAHTHSACEYIF